MSARSIISVPGQVATRRTARHGVTLLLPAALMGCASLAADFPVTRGFDGVASSVQAATGQSSVLVSTQAEARAVANETRDLVQGRTIDANTAVRVALINNKGLQAAYADLGLSVADLWQESLGVNPSVALSAQGIGPMRTVEGVLVANLLALTTRKRRLAVAETRVRQAQQVAIEETLRVAGEARRAWVEAAGAWGVVAQLNQSRVAADAAAELAGELGRTGAFNKAEQARNQVFYAELTGEIAQARLAAKLAKERLTRVLGLWGDAAAYEVPNGLPGLPSRLQDKSKIERLALANRADLKVAQLELEALAKSYGLTQATRYVSDLTLAGGLEYEREAETEVEEDGTETRDVTERFVPRGELEFEIPIFDSGQARMRKAELDYMRAANVLAQKAVEVRSEARAAYQAYRGTHDIARHYRDAVVPLRQEIEAEGVLTYNGMITNTFDLLADARARIGSLIQAENARRAFFLAEVDLTAAIYGGGMEGGVGAAIGGGGGEDE